MARRMSFAMTKRQYLDGSKTVTRRLGWLHARAGMEIEGIEKGMGLKKGERQVLLGPAIIIDARRERLDAITAEDCAREGFPGMSPAEFVAMFCEAGRCKPSTIVTRIEFSREEPSIPSTYTHADKLGAGGRAALAGARLVWDGLSGTMRRWLGDARHRPPDGSFRTPHNTPAPTSEALIARGLARPHGWLTPLGLLVREAGTRTPKDPSP